MKFFTRLTFVLFIMIPISLISQGVVINEFMAANTNTVADQDGEYDDWIELYNNSGESYDLSNHYLSDKSDNLVKWVFPDGTIIGPNAYLIVWADENGSEEGLHANFKLLKSGEEIYLTTPQEQIMDEVVFGTQESDKSYARIPNGTGDFVIQTATFAQNNDDASSTANLIAEMDQLILYPNPSKNIVHIILPKDESPSDILIINSIGVGLNKLKAKEKNEIDVSNWDKGLYYVKMGAHIKRLIVQ